MDQHELMIRVLCEAGGHRVEELLPTDYHGKRADVVFTEEGVVAEVKTIGSDRTADPETAAALGKMFSENVAMGAPILFEPTTIGLHDLPQAVAEKALRIIGRRVQRETRDANRQIKATWAALGIRDPYGLFVLVTPSHGLDRDSIGWLISDALRGGTRRGINGVVIVETPISAAMPSPSGPDSYLQSHSRGGRVLPPQLWERIGHAWGVVTKQKKHDIW
jgi:hypothetical protein